VEIMFLAVGCALFVVSRPLVLATLGATAGRAGRSAPAGTPGGRQLLL
jgi:hypothetical protein